MVRGFSFIEEIPAPSGDIARGSRLYPWATIPMVKSTAFEFMEGTPS